VFDLYIYHILALVIVKHNGDEPHKNYCSGVTLSTAHPNKWTNPGPNLSLFGDRLANKLQNLITVHLSDEAYINYEV
jgi:hypothetical protein